MQIVVQSVAVVTALASIGMALWTWRAMAGIGEGLNDLHFHDRSGRS